MGNRLKDGFVLCTTACALLIVSPAIAGDWAAWIASLRSSSHQKPAPKHVPAPKATGRCGAPLSAVDVEPWAQDPVQQRLHERWELPKGWMHHKVYGAEHKETVVLIHGLTGDLRTYDGVAKSLSQFYRVVTVDLRGHGETPAYGWNYSGELLASDVKALLDQLNQQWTNPVTGVHIVGHSFGGKVALRFAESFPDFTKTVVIEDMHFLPASAEDHAQTRADGWERAVTTMHTKTPQAGIELRATAVGPSQQKQWQALSDKEFVVALFASQVRYDNYNDALRGLKVPILFVRPKGKGALNDRGVAHARKLRPNLQLVDVEGADHDVHNSRQDDYLRAVGEFLAANVGR